MWIITAFSDSNIRMYEFETMGEAENFMKTISSTKVLTFVE